MIAERILEGELSKRGINQNEGIDSRDSSQRGQAGGGGAAGAGGQAGGGFIIFREIHAWHNQQHQGLP